MWEKILKVSDHRGQNITVHHAKFIDTNVLTENSRFNAVVHIAENGTKIWLDLTVEMPELPWH